MIEQKLDEIIKLMHDALARLDRADERMNVIVACLHRLDQRLEGSEEIHAFGSATVELVSTEDNSTDEFWEEMKREFQRMRRNFLH